mgnify:FL=1
MNGSAIDAVIWDVVGTLVDTIPLCANTLAFSIAHHGGPELTPHDVLARFGPTEEGLLRNVLGDEWVEAIETYLTVYEERHEDEAEVFATIRATVAAMADAGVPMAVVTGKGARSADITLRIIGRLEAFETVAPGSMEGSVKRQEIGRIVEGWGIAAGRVAYVGDMPSDIVEARSVGVVSVAAAWKPDAHTEELAALEPDVLMLDQEAMAAWVDATMTRPGGSSAPRSGSEG